MTEEDRLIEYKMKSDLFKLDELRQHADFVVRRMGDAMYIGTMSNNKRNGQGVMKYK